MLTDRIVMRPRANAEAMDLGFQLTRTNWPSMLGMVLIGLVPILALAGVALIITPWLALLVLWWFKPSINRGLLEILARDLTHRPTHPGVVLADRRQWWRGGHLASLTWYRFHPSRSMVLPIWQLERLTGGDRAQRTRALMHGNNGSAMGLTFVAGLFELCLVLGLFVLFTWVAPSHIWHEFDFWETGLIHIPTWIYAVLLGCYATTIVLVEPFYVGGGFGLYLNQRCRLECWDLEPVFRQISERHDATIQQSPS